MTLSKEWRATFRHYNEENKIVYVLKQSLLYQLEYYNTNNEEYTGVMLKRYFPLLQARHDLRMDIQH